MKEKFTEKEFTEQIREKMAETLKEALQKIADEQIEEATQKLRRQASDYIASMGVRIAKWVDIQQMGDRIVITLEIKEKKDEANKD